jgi:hypothetical protein
MFVGTLDLSNSPRPVSSSTHTAQRQSQRRVLGKRKRVVDIAVADDVVVVDDDDDVVDDDDDNDVAILTL